MIVLLIPLCIAFLIPKILFPFSTKNSLTWGRKWEKIKLQKIVGKLLGKNCTEWKVHPENFSLPQAVENSRQLLLLRTDTSQKKVVGCPWFAMIRKALYQGCSDWNKFPAQCESLDILLKVDLKAGARVHLRTCMFTYRDKRSHFEAIGVVNQVTR